MMSELPNRNPETGKPPIELGGDSEQGEPRHAYSLEVFYGFHGLEHDYESLKPLLKQADVFIPENLAWDDEYVEKFNRISQGEALPLSVLFSNKAPDAPVRWIQGTKKHVALVDITWEHPAREKIYAGFEKIHNAFIIALKGGFDEAISEVREGVALETIGNVEREEHIAQELRELIPHLTDQFPDLKDKKDIKVLMAIGATHTALTRRLREEAIPGVQLHSRRADKVTRFSHLEELTRRQQEGKEITDELCAQVIIEDLIKWTAYLEDITCYTNQENTVLRDMISSLSIDDIRAIFKPLEDESTFSNRKVREVLWKYGVKIEDEEDQDIYADSE